MAGKLSRTLTTPSEETLWTELAQAQRDYRAAVDASDFDVAGVHIGEGIGIIRDSPPAAEMLARIEREARVVLDRLDAAFPPGGEEHPQQSDS